MAVGKTTFVPQYTYVGARKPITCSAVTLDVSPDGEKKHVGVRLTTSFGDIVVRLRPDLAHNTAESFASLTAQGFYDGLTFHRIVAGFMAQGGRPEGRRLRRVPGTTCRSSRTAVSSTTAASCRWRAMTDPDTAGSQFFLMFARRASLDPTGPQSGYTVFGQMVEGDDALAKIEAVETRVKPAIVDQLRTRYKLEGEELERALNQLVATQRIEKSEPVEPVSIKKATLLTLE